MANTMLLTETRTFSKQDLVSIYEEHSPGIFRYAVRMLGDRDLAEDCVSETFSRFLHAVRQGGGPRDNLRAYLYRVAHNWITHHYRIVPIHGGPIDEPAKAALYAELTSEYFIQLDHERALVEGSDDVDF